MSDLIGREFERKELQKCFDSNRSELVIVYGRRRVGKTFLIEEVFGHKYAFTYTGAHGMTTRQQLANFAYALKSQSGKKIKSFRNWIDAFRALQEHLEDVPTPGKKVVFIDEMPWMDSGRSNFVVALENFWNGWAARRRDILLIATGSATSWMRDKLIANKGGLHARITCRLHLMPFTLHETELYLEKTGYPWDRYHLLQAYMLLGGVPFYYSLLSPELSLAQNIDLLFFREGASLREEFEELYSALFSNTAQYINMVHLLSEHKAGLTSKQISQSLGYKGGKVTTVIKNLERSDIIEPWVQYGNKRRGTVYRLTDFFTLFYYKFVATNHSKDDKWWSNHLDSRAIAAWMGIAFELVCMKHHRQIKDALGISGMSTETATWHVSANEDEGLPGAQVDLIIDRADRILHLCEMKFSQDKFPISKDYEMHLRERMGLFKMLTKTKKTVVHTFVTTYGVTDGKHKSIVHSEVTMDDLFKT